SDSDMYTLGYAFRPWREAKAIADGPSILRYIRDTAAEYGIDRKIRFRHRVRRVAWSSQDARWTVEAERTDTGGTVRLTCGFLLMCSGYYSYASGHAPEFPGMARFRGRIVHPQFWPADYDDAGRRVVVIGSGATAVTLVPELARTAAHVTMLQRSPTYMVARPSQDDLANRLRRRLPAKLAYGVTRWKNIGFSLYFHRLARRRPARVKAALIGMVRQALGADYDVATHFTPRYNPWDQRLCLVPDADMFKAIRSGRAAVVTDTIETFTETGLQLSSGAELPADIIVTATGLRLNLLGDVSVFVDGARVDPAQCLSYKGMMLSDVPNLATVFGYTNASWTLKADLIASYVCRLLNHMRRHGYTIATPQRAAAADVAPFIDFSSGYVQRAIHMLPKQGAQNPWRVHQNYLRDLRALRFAPVADGVMRFSRATDRPRARVSAADRRPA
ncbi:MAG TPA: NAD(P)/FAD-dependent oxidoreductase, partial [Acetobacteraceae bacterium]|nr:NAD(P)/FAD-dependent oxidoreductase [Acetobacteraceae bacterium]